jgi:hypothetical protein
MGLGEESNGAAMFSVGAFTVMLIIEKIFTIYHSLGFVDEFIPARVRKD